MQLKTILLLVSASTFYLVGNAQTVTTLVNDSFRQFESIHWHPDGRIYSADYVNGNLYEIETDGTVQTLVQGIPAMVGGGFDANDNFYFCSVAAGGNVYRLNANNTHTIVASGLNQPISVLTTAHQDTIYVTEYGGNSVAKVSLSSGVVIPWASASGLSGPDAIIYNHLNEIIVANFSNSKVFKVSPSGTIYLFSTVPAPGFLGYCTSVGTKLYVPSIGGKQVFVIDETGNATLLAGTGQSGSNDGAANTASFSSPNGICSNPAGDTLLVTDGKRIRVITDFNTTTGLEENNSNFEFMIHPNAVQKELHLTIEATNSYPDEWVIYDTSGKMIMTERIHSIKKKKKHLIDVGGLPKGSYLLTLMQNDSILGTKSFLKSD